MGNKQKARKLKILADKTRRQRQAQARRLKAKIEETRENQERIHALEGSLTNVPDPRKVAEDNARGEFTVRMLQASVHLFRTMDELDPVTFRMRSMQICSLFDQLVKASKEAEDV